MLRPSPDAAEFRTPQLYGRVEAVRIWIDSELSEWQPGEIARTSASITEAERWLVRQARAWGFSLEFRRPGSRDLRVRLPDLPGGHGTGPEMSISDWIERISPLVGWSSPGAFLTGLQAEAGIEHAHILLLIRQEGRSYALSNEHADDASEAMPVAACFLSSGEGGIRAATIAHETLHLYGAWDLYADRERHREQSDHAARLFAGDIMQASGDIDRLRVSDLTAWRLGWLQSGPGWFEFFSPALSREDRLLESMERPPDSFGSLRDQSVPGAGGTSSGGDPLQSLFEGASWIFRELGTLIRRWSDFPRRAGWTHGGQVTGAGRVESDPARHGRGSGRKADERVQALEAAGTEPATGRRGGRRLRRRAGERQDRTVPVAKREAFVIDRLMSLDPLADATVTVFDSLMRKVLESQSVAEASAIALGPDPEPPARLVGGPSNPRYQLLRLELATIRRAIRKQGAGGVVEEERLHRAVEEWKRFVQHWRAGEGGAVGPRANEAYRRGVLILDSIQRRDVGELRRAVVRFHQLRQQLGP